MKVARPAIAFLLGLSLSGWGFAQGADPRTAAGQLAACGGAANWNRMTFVEFEVEIDSPQGKQGPWLYRWDRSGGYGRLTGPGPDGSYLDIVVDIASRSGGGARNGEPMSEELLGQMMTWAVQRMAEDILWLTFPLDWNAPGVTLTPLDDVLDEDGRRHRSVLVTSAVGSWDVTLDPDTGRIVRTVYERPGVGRFNVEWSNWEAHGGVFFAGRRSIEETGEEVMIQVLRHGSTPPPDAF